MALEHRHGNDFQKVPARHQGDYGLDGYIRDTTLFQCYGDRAGSSSAQRSTAQKAKLRIELPKLKKNAVPIDALVGSGVHEYVFLVSQLEDKSVLEYAAEREEELHSWKLSYLAPDCRVVVKDIDYLRPEWELFYGAVRGKLNLPELQLSDTEVDAWLDTDDELVSTLRGKLATILASEEVPLWLRRLVRRRLEEEDLMDRLRSKGLTWQRVRELKADREERLDERALAPDPRADLLALCDDYRSNLQQEITSLHYRHAHSLAWGAAADWLMRCPLRYDS